MYQLIICAVLIGLFWAVIFLARTAGRKEELQRMAEYDAEVAKSQLKRAAEPKPDRATLLGRMRKNEL